MQKKEAEMNNNVKKYFELLEQWMKYYGFEKINVHAESGIDLVYKRSRAEALKFGKVDTYVCAKYFETSPTSQEFRQFSDKMMSMAMRHRNGMPLGFGAMLVTFPLVVVDQITNELASETRIYCPKHFAAAEFPSVISLATSDLYFYPDTPIWGYAYYAGYRNEVFRMFSPKSWEKIGKT